MESGRGVSERILLLLLAGVQFTHIMDFMVMMPLGPQLMRELDISPASFGHIISAFAITAGVVGLAMAPFADRFDRRKLLLFCYAGFALGTLACGLSSTPGMLMAARAMCGAFGGVSSATLMTSEPYDDKSTAVSGINGIRDCASTALIKDLTARTAQSRAELRKSRKVEESVRKPVGWFVRVMVVVGQGCVPVVRVQASVTGSFQPSLQTDLTPSLDGPCPIPIQRSPDGSRVPH